MSQRGQSTTGIGWVEGRDIAKHPIMHSTDPPHPYNKVLSSPKSQVLRVRHSALQLSEMGELSNVLDPTVTVSFIK